VEFAEYGSGNPALRNPLKPTEPLLVYRGDEERCRKEAGAINPLKM
jgi:hypothetical protein